MTMILLVAGAMLLAGCKEKSDAQPETPTAAESAKKPTQDESSGGHHGKPIELGTARIGDFDVRASRDEGKIVAGKDAPIDVWLTGDIAAVKAVRFWIGTKTGETSMKARANIENPDEPNHWHTHAEIPNPIPEGSQLWVEIETAESTGSGAFELKA